MAASESTFKTITVALLVTVVSSVLVSGTVVALKPMQENNKKEEKKKNVLLASGIYNEEEDINQQFQNFEPVLIDISTGEFAKEEEQVPADEYEMSKMLKEAETSIELEPVQDKAGIRKIPRLVQIYFLKKEDKVENLILPIYGKGLWSTMYGFLVLEKDFNTIKGITFYEHGETPGLGGEIDNPRWKALWQGKQVFNEQGEYKFAVIKGSVSENDPANNFHVDGLSGATLTGRGVSNTIAFWMGQDGYGKFLNHYQSEGNTNE